jgi:hypothetical protein
MAMTIHALVRGLEEFSVISIAGLGGSLVLLNLFRVNGSASMVPRQ